MPEPDDTDTLPELDVAPEHWVEEHPEPTAEEIELGNRLGATIDIDDDADNGGVGVARGVTTPLPEMEQTDES